MDSTFRPSHVGNPADGKTIELWSGNECIRGYKKDGRWFAEDGTAIMVQGWRPINKEEGEPESLPDYADRPKPKAKAKPAKHRHK